MKLRFSALPADPLAPAILISAFTPAARLAFVGSPPSKNGDWQTAPCRQFLLLLAGENETEVSDGEVRRFGPGSIILLEDTRGRGHNGRFVGTEDALIALIELPD